MKMKSMNKLPEVRVEKIMKEETYEEVIARQREEARAEGRVGNYLLTMEELNERIEAVCLPA